MNSKPFVISGHIDRWPASRWTPDQLVDIFGDRRLSARFGSTTHRCGRGVLYETDCIRRDNLSFGDFYRWSQMDDDSFKIDRASHWGYVDYKYMFESVAEQRLADVDWRVFGIDADGTDSSIWIGTSGAYTPCHYDTYGFNLHAQLFGHKRWILFPPTDDMLPTRIPYEESSVFSQYDILNCERSSTSASLHPHVVTLAPGDVLFVPPYWWHFVQCIDFSISVNTWPPLAEHIDQLQQRREACVRALIGLISKSGLINDDLLLCPSEMANGGCNWKNAIETIAASTNANANDDDDDQPEANKRARRSSTPIKYDDDILDKFVDKFASIGTPLKEMLIDELRLMLRNEGPLQLIDNDDDNETSSVVIDDRRFINCLLSRDVIAILANAVFDNK